jgi:hypothetical protein
MEDRAILRAGVEGPAARSRGPEGKLEGPAAGRRLQCAHDRVVGRERPAGAEVRRRASCRRSMGRPTEADLVLTVLARAPDGGSRARRASRGDARLAGCNTVASASAPSASAKSPRASVLSRPRSARRPRGAPDRAGGGGAAGKPIVPGEVDGCAGGPASARGRPEQRAVRRRRSSRTAVPCPGVGVHASAARQVERSNPATIRSASERARDRGRRTGGPRERAVERQRRWVRPPDALLRELRRGSATRSAR